MAATVRDALAIDVMHCLRSPLGGLFRHVCDLVIGQSELGMKVGVICDDSTGGPQAQRRLAELQPHCALGITRLPMKRVPHWSDLQLISRVRQICNQSKPDIVHGHGAKGGAYARLAARSLETKSVYTPHGGSLHYNRASLVGAAYLYLERFLQRNTDGVIFECQYSADTFRQKVDSISIPHRIVHHGLLDAELAPLAPEARQADFVFVGELRELKGVNVLLDAMRLLVRRRTATLLIAGSGPDASRFNARVRALGLSDAVTISPPVYPATRAFAAAECVVIPSLTEAFPYIVLEAAGARVPLLATAVGGIPEIFGPYRDWLVPARDPDALADAMLATLDDLEQARDKAARLHERVKSLFRQETMVCEIAEFYMRLLHGV